MLCTDLIAQLANRESGSVKVPILPLPVERSGVPDNVIVNMRFINMSTDNKSKAILQKPLCKFISDSICLFRCDLPGLEGLPYLIGDNIILLCAPIENSILALGQEKLIGHRFGVALKRRDQFIVICLVGVLHIISTIPQRLCQGLSLVHVYGNNASGCYGFNSFFLNNLATHDIVGTAKQTS